VPGFLSLGDESEAVFRELESEGYEVWPLVLGADDVGAPHRRKRLWIVANSERGESGTGHKFDMQRRRAREAEQIRMGCGIQLANLTSGGFGIDGSAPRRGGHVDECGEGVANGNGSLGIHADQKIRSGRISAVNGRWPARPGERQHEWEQPRIIKFGVGFCAVRIFRWLDGRFLGERYGKATKTRPSEVLRVLLGEAGEEEIRRFVGGHDEVYAETILQHQLHGTEADIRNPDSPNDVQAGWGSQEDILRTLRRIDEFGYSSHRRESDEQCSREHQDALRFVSHEITLANREIGTPEGVLCRVWKRCESARILPETLVPLGEVWRSVADEEKLRAVQGTIGPCLVKRMSRWNKNSLRCFGNSIVPQCSEAIGRAIMQVEQQTKGSNHEA
jgi:site-specific DNA-cytosine methylase